jgi:hypothetical protein
MGAVESNMAWHGMAHRLETVRQKPVSEFLTQISYLLEHARSSTACRLSELDTKPVRASMGTVKMCSNAPQRAHGLGRTLCATR